MTKTALARKLANLRRRAEAILDAEIERGNLRAIAETAMIRCTEDGHELVIDLLDAAISEDDGFVVEATGALGRVAEGTADAADEDFARAAIGIITRHRRTGVRASAPTWGLVDGRPVLGLVTSARAAA